jgi:anti-sigma regulatory factor (Ser/Thr protein kinase)
MIEAVAARHGLDRARSWMVGDKETDVEAGRRAGCRTILLAPAAAAAGTRADHVCADLAHAAALVASGEETLATLRIESREAEILPVVERALEAVRAAGFAGRGEPRLKLALIELVANAIEHGNRFDPERAVTVSVRRRGERLLVAIADEGPGFDPARRARDLDEVDVSAKRGRGLGLVMRILGEPPRAEGSEVVIGFDKGRFA